MRQSKTVPYSGPPALQAIEAGPVRTVLQDVYRHLCQETKPVVQQVAAAPGRGAWTDRGDPSAPDRTTWTQDNAWHDWDLSSIVGVGSRLVLLRVIVPRNHSTVIAFRKKGNIYEYNVAKVLEKYDDEGAAVDVWVQTDENAVVEYKCTSGGSDTRVTIAGWWS